MKGLARIPIAQHRDPDAIAERLARIAEVEDEVFQTSAAVAQATLDFHLVTPDQQEPPPEWVAEYGESAARQRLAVAKAGWMPQSVAPSAVGHAFRVVTGIAKARRQGPQSFGPAEINVTLKLPVPTSAGQPGAPEYPSKEVE